MSDIVDFATYRTAGDVEAKKPEVLRSYGVVGPLHLSLERLPGPPSVLALVITRKGERASTVDIVARLPDNEETQRLAPFIGSVIFHAMEATRDAVAPAGPEIAEGA